MAIETISVRVDDSEPRIFRIWVGDMGYPVERERFKELMLGKGISHLNIEHLIRNLAIRAALGGAVLDNPTSIKLVLESATYKV